jgi:hypothetical protein
MTYLEFFNKWNGKTTDVDGAFGAQCMDLMHQYLMDCFSMDKNALAAPAAVDVFLRFPNVPQGAQFTKTNNTWYNVPKQGDVIFWGTKIGPYGHVAIVNTANVLNFSSFDQNWGPDRNCRLVNHNYTGVLGWLRKR